MATFEVVSEDDPRLKRCGNPSSSGRMHCEFLPLHLEPYHFGRDRLGRWRYWKVRRSRQHPFWGTTPSGN